MGELSKLFGKAFAVGFLLPAAAFGLGLAALLSRFGLMSDPLRNLFDAKIADVAVSVALLWLGAVCLLALNRPILRFMEGYYWLNPLRPLRRITIWRYRCLSKRADELRIQQNEAKRTGIALPERTRAERAKVLLRLANDFPDQEVHVLPTTFGNVMRAYEVYPRVVYGLEGIQGWNRLVAVLPDGFRAQIEDAKSQTDFWVNLRVVAILLIGVYATLAWPSAHWATACPFLHVKHLWMAELAGGLALVSIPLAVSMAREWGGLVMSAFDLYRAELANKLGLDLPRSIEHERQMWGAFSRTTVYRSSKEAERLGPYRAKAGSGTSS